MTDFKVAMGRRPDQSGSACRNERIATYNRLLEIERELAAAVFNNPLTRRKGKIRLPGVAGKTGVRLKGIKKRLKVEDRSSG